VKKISAHPSSYKDPSGFIYSKDGKMFRQINASYKRQYDHLMTSGLYDELIRKKLLVSHEEVKAASNREDVYKTIRPTVIPFISYPYEWSFGALRDAALCTLRVQQIALRYGMSLKDASPFNIQFFKGHPVLIDTLSFEMFPEGKPWVAYKQFCEEFLGPLSLSGYTDSRMQSLLRGSMGKVSLDLCSRLLPLRAKLNLGILIHVVLHARSIGGTNRSQTETSRKTMSSGAFSELIENLKQTVRSIPTPSQSTYWSDYADDGSPISYSDRSNLSKRKIVTMYLKKLNPTSVWDLGANTGDFSRLASDRNLLTISMDIDPIAVNRNYQRMKENRESHILPLVVDFMNPTPMMGWANEERDSLFARPHPDTIMALALLHHLAIGQNVPLQKIAHLFSSLCTSLIIEFVPKEDPQVIGLLSHRTDIFSDYSQDTFEKIFSAHFSIDDSKKITDSHRTLYCMTKK
jgi:putative effector of murein hydrolase LrgA (UPF0299 family)